MFQSSPKRLRAWLDRIEAVIDDALSYDPPDDARPDPHSAYLAHPHRRPLRWQHARRPGSVAPAPTACLSPVRSQRPVRASQRVSR
jgi:hypothetical protein